MKIEYDNFFWYDKSNEKSKVFQLYPDVYEDNRGSFSEVLKYSGMWKNGDNSPLWFSNLDWIRQINRSKSTSGVIRGCHAQRGQFCQGKLVESIKRRIYDVITDARPESKTFGVTKIFMLDDKKQNKLWVPRGFLHGFVIPYEESTNEEAIFNYYVDNSYNKDSEICVNPSTIIPKVAKIMRDSNENVENFRELYEIFESNPEPIYSEKDMNGTCYEEFMNNVQSEYLKNGKSWYM